MIGSGIGGLPLIENMRDELVSRGLRRISPFFVPASIINMISGHVSMRFGFWGRTSPSSRPHHRPALAAMAGRMIEYGDADVVVAGGSWGHRLAAGRGRLLRHARALDAQRRPRPRPSWDKDRDGFVLGEGAGVMVLEEYEHAKARGARIYAELSGYGMSADAGHMTAPNMDGPRRACSTLRNAGVNADQVDYLNAHGTSTPLGDVNETNAIKAARATTRSAGRRELDQVDDRPPAGRCGGIESMFTVLALHHQISAADDQHLQPGSRLRPGLLRQHRARDEDRLCPEEQLRLRRHQRLLVFKRV